MTNSPQQTLLPYRDAERPIAERVADLLGRMTVEEKVGQMLQLDARDDLDAHVLQTTTTVGDTAVAYGIGNFVFGSGSSAETRASGVLTVTVPGDAGAPTMTFDPARVTQGLPVLLEGAERERALQTWRARGEGCS